MRRIFSLRLENFRQYRGKTRIDFSTDEEQNFTIILGGGGSGKTNLANSILWCMYGKESSLRFGALSDASRSPRSLMYANVCAIRELERNKTADVSISIRIGQETPSYIIRRTTRVQKDLDGQMSLSPSKLNVMRLPENREWEEYQNPHAFVETLLPESVSHFFILNGDRLDFLFEKDGRPTIGHALMELARLWSST